MLVKIVVCCRSLQGAEYPSLSALSVSVHNMYIYVKYILDDILVQVNRYPPWKHFYVYFLLCEQELRIIIITPMNVSVLVPYYTYLD